MMFSSHIKFEIKRQVKNTKNIAVAALYIAALFIFFGYNIYMDMQATEHNIEEYNIAIEELTGHLMVLTENPYAPQPVIDLVADDLRILRMQRTFATWMDGPRLDDELEHNIRRLERILTGLWAVGENNTFLPSRYQAIYSEEILVIQIQYFRYLQNINVHPMQSPYNMQGWHFLHRLVYTLVPFVLPLLLVLFASDVFSSEKDSGSFKFLLIQPVSRLRVYLVKLLVSFILVSIVIITPLLMLFGISSLIFGTGYSGYPVLFHAESATENIPRFTDHDMNEPIETLLRIEVERMQIRNDFLATLNPHTNMPNGMTAISSYFILIMLPFGSYLLFLLSLVVLISILAIDSVSAMSISFGAVLLSFITQEYLPASNFMWNPIAWSDLDGVLSTMPLWSFWYIVIWAIALVAFGMLCFKRKNM